MIETAQPTRLTCRYQCPWACPRRPGCAQPVNWTTGAGLGQLDIVPAPVPWIQEQAADIIRRPLQYPPPATSAGLDIRTAWPWILGAAVAAAALYYILRPSKSVRRRRALAKARHRYQQEQAAARRKYEEKQAAIRRRYA